MLFRPLTIAALAATLLFAAPAQAEQATKEQQKQTSIELKSQTGRGEKDPNIKQGRPANDPNAPDKPVQRGDCEVHVDNRTPWYIDIFVDGTYRGVIGPFGDGYTLAIPGPTTLYGRADFRDGSYKSWGPIDFRCPRDGEHTVTLYR